MNTSKPWYQSKTVLAAVAILVLVVNNFFGIALSDSDILSVLESVGIAIAAVIALFGRVTAKKTLTT